MMRPRGMNERECDNEEVRTLRGSGDESVLDLLRKVDPEEIADMRHEWYGSRT